MRAGLLRHRGFLQYDASLADLGATADDDGRPQPNWQSLDATGGAQPLPCEVTPVSAGESYLGVQMQSQVTYGVLLRWRGDVLPQMRFIWIDDNDRVLYIAAATDPDGRRERLLLQCRETR